MYFRWKISQIIFYYSIIYSTLTFCDAELSSSRVNIGYSQSGGKNYSIEVIEEYKYLRDSNNVVEAMCHDFKYPVRTRLELTNLAATKSDPVQIARFRRDDKTVTQNGSGKDYMSDYYEQRKAIMDKYKSQQKLIMERLKKTKITIAENKKLKESKKTYSDYSNVTKSRIDSDSLLPNITSQRNSTILPNLTSSSVDFNRSTNNLDSKNSIFNSTIFNADADSNKSFLYSSEDQETNNSTDNEIRILDTTLSPSFVIDETDRADIETSETIWPTVSANSIPQNELDFNLTDENLFVRKERDNVTVLVNNPSPKNNSALDQLEEMFLWDVPAGDETIPRSDAGNKVENNSNTGNTDSNSTGSLDSLRFMVEIKSSPEVHVNKNVKNIQTSTTTYRNSTHEIVEINGVVNSTKRIDVSPDVDQPDLRNINSTTPVIATGRAAEPGGGAEESEWCELCPHDYRWGNCEGTLFYQHNIFLRNRGPSAIDAIFGMNVQGPVYITCVEAIRFNNTRGIVTLYSGGPANDFAKLRIRGFQGEGFSYIMKVWGVSNDQESIISSTNQPDE